jgi:hypothetical protein
MAQYSLSIPPRCPQCGKTGSIELQHIVKGTSVLLTWACRSCETDWPVSRGEPHFVERRKAKPNRRPAAHPERRKRR